MDFFFSAAVVGRDERDGVEVTGAAAGAVLRGGEAFKWKLSRSGDDGLSWPERVLELLSTSRRRSGFDTAGSLRFSLSWALAADDRLFFWLSTPERCGA